MVLETLQNEMISEARSKHGQNILPPVSKKSFDECFTHFCGKYCFWFNNRRTGSTHLIVRELDTLPTAG